MAGDDRKQPAGAQRLRAAARKIRQGGRAPSAERLKPKAKPLDAGLFGDESKQQADLIEEAAKKAVPTNAGMQTIW
jgi:hypothetical protein